MTTSPNIVPLKGKRFVIMEEPESDKLHTGPIMQLTGCDTMDKSKKNNYKKNLSTYKKSLNEEFGIPERKPTKYDKALSAYKKSLKDEFK